MPQVAIGHDLRLKTLYGELGIEGESFFNAEPEVEWPRLTKRVEEMLANPGPERDRLRRGHESHLAAARRNRELLRGFLDDNGWTAGA